MQYSKHSQAQKVYSKCHNAEDLNEHDEKGTNYWPIDLNMQQVREERYCEPV